MSKLNLTKVLMGLTNYNHDHVLRNPSLNIQNHHLDELVASRLGNTNGFHPGKIQELAMATCGMNAQALAPATIEDGWAVSRGLAYMEFDVSNGGYRIGCIGVYGYLHGGDQVVPGMPVPDNIMFVPVRTWTVDIVASQDPRSGLAMEKQKLTRSSQYLMSVNGRDDGLYSNRPYDILGAGLTIATAEAEMKEQNRWLSGGDDNGADQLGQGLSASMLSAGPALTDMSHNSPIRYGEILLGAAADTTRSSSQGTGFANAIAGGMTNQQIGTADGIDDDTFGRVMSNRFGSSLVGGSFSGWSIGEIATVFENFGSVSKTELTDLNNNTVADNRMYSNGHNGAGYGHAIANDVLQIATSIMASDQGKLSYLEFKVDNGVEHGQLKVNHLDVGYQLGQSMPMMSEDPNWMYAPEYVTQQLCYQLYPRFNTEHFHDRMMVTVTASIALFGESTISVITNGDPSTEVVLTFSTCCGNRFDPMLTNHAGYSQTANSFCNNLKKYLGQY